MLRREQVKGHSDGGNPLAIFRFLVLLTFLCPGATNAEQRLAAERLFSVRHVGVDDGLSQSHATTMVQDKAGFVWIGTAVGLNRYNGHEFKTFTHVPGIASSIANDGIYTLHVDAAGVVWVGTASGLDRYDPAKDSFDHFPAVTKGRSRRVRALTSAPDGTIWAAPEGEGSQTSLSALNPVTGSVRYFALAGLLFGEVVHLSVLAPDRVLFVVRDGAAETHPCGFAVGTLDPRTGKVTEYRPPALSQAASPPDERDISVAWTQGKLMIGAPGGLVFRVDPSTQEIRPLAYAPLTNGPNTSGLVSHVVQGSEGAVWVIPTWNRPGRYPFANALYRIDSDGKSNLGGRWRPNSECDLSRSMVISSLIDRSGVLWTGMSGAGLCISDLESLVFSHYHEESSGLQLRNNFVRALWKTDSDVMWVGTRSGLNRIDRRLGQVRYLEHSSTNKGSLSDNEVRSLLVSRDGALWVGTQRGGLNRSTDDGRSFHRFRHRAGDPHALPNDCVSSLLEDRDGTIWVGTGEGLAQYLPESRSFRVYRPQPNPPATPFVPFVTGLIQDSNGLIWLAIENHGLFRFDRQTGRFAPIDLGFEDPLRVLSIAEDPVTRGALWVGTLQHGLIRYDPLARQSKRFSTRNSAMPSDTVYSVLADNAGSMWAGTNRGLVRLDVRTSRVDFFGMDQGIQSMEFNTRACFRARDGEILIGGVGGMNAFYPAAVVRNRVPAQVAITHVRPLNPGTDPPGPVDVIDQGAGSGRVMRFPASHRNLEFGYVALHFSDPSRNTYKVLLEGVDGGWREVGAVREVAYTNLAPGNYTFRVKATTSRGVASPDEARFAFEIESPLYKKPWFLALCAASTLFLTFQIHRMRLRRIQAANLRLETEVKQRTEELRNALEVNEHQSAKLRDVDALKSRFITNVSHEFRTPLTVTVGVLTDLHEGAFGPVSAEAEEQIETVIRNEKRLLKLVEQLMAIARIDSGKLRLRIAAQNLTALAENLLRTYGSLARTRCISLSLKADGPVTAYVDPNWIEDVLSSLVSNALKFTPDGGSVTVEVGGDADSGRIRLAVTDTGTGIPVHELPHIFDRFYQAEPASSVPDAGIGVGLSLAKEIVELHQGEIRVQSEPGRGSTFEVLLLPGSEHFEREQMPSQSPEEPRLRGLEYPTPLLPYAAFRSEDGGRPLILIAEDDPDLADFLKRHLTVEYDVSVTESGRKALELVQSEIPDLVLSDVMLPEMDGVSLCREIRSHAATELVPVILLTAKSEITDRLEGLGTGADDYITKPFEVVELKAKIHNVLAMRSKLRTRLTAEFALDAAKSSDGIPVSSEAAFLSRTYQVIRENAHQMDFTVEELAKQLAMSRMHLYRRLRQLLGKSPAEVLVEYRLERAAQMLSAGAGSVSEVAYALGFKSVSHFARRFRDRFGMTPSDYRASPENREPR